MEMYFLCIRYAFPIYQKSYKLFKKMLTIWGGKNIFRLILINIRNVYKYSNKIIFCKLFYFMRIQKYAPCEAQIIFRPKRMNSYNPGLKAVITMKLFCLM